jgi:hypothetical protein
MSSLAVAVRAGWLVDCATGATWWAAADARASSDLVLSAAPAAPPAARVDLARALVRPDAFDGAEVVTAIQLSPTAANASSRGG